MQLWRQLQKRNGPLQDAAHLPSARASFSFPGLASPAKGAPQEQEAPPVLPSASSADRGTGAEGQPESSAVRALRAKAEELEEQQRIAQEMNRHLNSEVEALSAELRALRSRAEAQQGELATLKRPPTLGGSASAATQTSVEAATSVSTQTPSQGEAGAAPLRVPQTEALLPGSPGTPSRSLPGAEGGTQLDAAPGSPQSQASEHATAGWPADNPDEHSNGPGPTAQDEGSAGEGEEGLPHWLCDQRWATMRSIGEAASWLVEPEEVERGQVLGRGMFGTSHRGWWRGGLVAVKCVRVACESEATSFLREVAALAALRHPNILPFYGACLQPPEQCWLLTEFQPGGTLSHWLHGDRLSGGRAAPRRPMEERLQMALGVAQGMQALEATLPPILHRDLKPSNVFIDAMGQPRVADMGLARRLTPAAAASLTGETGTYQYMAPEVIRHEPYDQKADVFSWGVLLAECVGQRPPYEALYLTPVQVALAVGDDQIRPTLPEGLPPVLTALARACYAPDPAARPTFAFIVDHMKQALAEVLEAKRAQGQQDSTFARFWGNGAPRARPSVAAAPGGSGAAAPMPAPGLPHTALGTVTVQ